MALVVFAGAGFAALRDPSVWWVGVVLAGLIGLLLTACVGAMYRTGTYADSGISFIMPPSRLCRLGFAW
jgi:hypothetical protein